MLSRLLFGGVLICSIAMLLFVSGFICLHLGLVLLATLIYSLAGKAILLSFGLLLLIGLVAIIEALQRELRIYFCQEAIAMRRVLALQAQKRQMVERSVLEWRQLQYLSQVKRQRLLAYNDKKHLRTLSEAIHQELRAMEVQTPGGAYQGISKTLRQHHKRADAEAMLALRQRLLCRG